MYECEHAHVRVCACVQMRVYAYVRVHECMCMSVHVCIWVCVRACGSVCTCECVHQNVCTCEGACTHECARTYERCVHESAHTCRCVCMRAGERVCSPQAGGAVGTRVGCMGASGARSHRDCHLPVRGGASSAQHSSVPCVLTGWRGVGPGDGLALNCLLVKCLQGPACAP